MTAKTLSRESVRAFCLHRIPAFFLCLKRNLHFHLIRLVMLAVVLVIIFRLPQIRNLWQQWPPLSMPGYFAKFAFFLLLMAWLYLPSWIAVARSDEQWRDAPQNWLTRLQLILCWPSRTVTGWLPGASLWATSHGGPGKKVPQVRDSIWQFGGILLSGVCGIFMFVEGARAHTSGVYILAGSFCRTAAFSFVAICVWLIGVSVIQWIWKRSPGSLWLAYGRFLAWFIVSLLLGEALWAESQQQWLGWDISYRLYTLWAVLHIFSLLVIGGALVDRTYSQTRLPARCIVVALAIWIMSTQQAHLVHDDSLGLMDLTAQQDTPEVTENISDEEIIRRKWLNAAQRRLASMPEGPVVIVAASGGGSRAALFSGLVFELLQQTPMSLPPAKVRPKGMAPEKVGTWWDHVWMISSVSGGSLAAAEFAAAPPTQTDPKYELKHTSRAELLQRMKGYVARRRNSFEHGDAQTVKDFEAVEKLLGGWKLDEPAISDFEWVLHSPKIDSLCTDFMAPIMRGACTPLSDRGDALAVFWKEHFRWDHHWQGTWSNEPRNRPLLLLNAADIQHGRQLITGFPALPPKLLAGTEVDHSARSFSELSPIDPGLSLARAVRLSSSFPWGFRVQRFNHTTQPPVVEPLDVLDGGVVDNTGVNSLRYVLDAVREQAEASPESLAAKTLNDLRRRGVIVIEIDSGAKPQPTPSNGVLSWVSAPLNSLNNAIYANAGFARDQHKRRLMKQLELQWNLQPLPAITIAESAGSLAKELERRRLPTVHWHTFTCNDINAAGADIMTAWALGPQDKAIVFAQFLKETQKWGRSYKKIEEQQRSASKNYEPLREEIHGRIIHQLQLETEVMVTELAADIQPGSQPPDEWNERLMQAATTVTAVSNFAKQTKARSSSRFNSLRDQLKSLADSIRQNPTQSVKATAMSAIQKATVQAGLEAKVAFESSKASLGNLDELRRKATDLRRANDRLGQEQKQMYEKLAK